jgi:hypothetical protein
MIEIKVDDKVYVTCFYGRLINKKSIVQATVKEIVGSEVWYKGHSFLNSSRCCAGLFYGYGYYHPDLNYAIITKKKWHVIPAWICEKIRLAIQHKVSVFIGLE